MGDLRWVVLLRCMLVCRDYGRKVRGGRVCRRVSGGSRRRWATLMLMGKESVVGRSSVVVVDGEATCSERKW